MTRGGVRLATQAPSHSPVAEPAAVHHPVKGPERQRDPLGLLQLQLRVVIEPERQVREDDARHDRGAAVLLRQLTHEERHPDAGQMNPDRKTML